MNYDEKIKALEEEIIRTQKNKATEKHIGLLMAKIAKLRREKIKEQLKSSKSGGGFDIPKTGDARVALLGFPSVGKSSLLNALTGKESKVSYYAFTTVTVVPSILEVNGAKIQLLDLPGILEDASKGRGRGKEVLSVIRTSDVIAMVVEATNPMAQYKALIKELEEFNIRVNTEPPKIRLSKRLNGPLKIYNHSNLDEEFIKAVLAENKINSADIYISEGTTEQNFVDFFNDSIVYKKMILIINKIDLVNDLKPLKNQFPEAILVSTFFPDTLEKLKISIYNSFNFIKIYTKSDKISEDPLVMKKGATVRDVCLRIHKDLYRNFKYALIWGKSAKFPGQRVGLDHIMEDGDIIQIFTK